ncbi:MAG: hypothetical protein HY064_03795 [Bacteroidetes bacterium]|nr:hypothetical protein [Bacteroidota bacterium]
MPPVVPKDILISYFQSGDEPTAAQFATLIGSTANLIDDRYLLGLRTYDQLKNYLIGDAAIYSNAVYQCIANTTGPFNPMKWQVIASLGSPVFAGTWNAITNTPTLASGVGTQSFYYVVSDASSIPSENTTLDGINDWVIGDWAIFSGAVWQKVSQSRVPVKAIDVVFDPTPEIQTDNVQDAIEEVQANLESGLATKQDELTFSVNRIPYADGVHSLGDSVLSNETDGVSIDNTKVFRSAVANKSQINFGATNDSIELSTDGGNENESTLLLTTGVVTLKHADNGELLIEPGADTLGKVTLKTNTGSGFTATTDIAQVVNAQTSVKVFSTGTIETTSTILKISSATINTPNLTASTVPYVNASKNIVSSSVTPTELGYISGLTSSAQAQLDGKVDLSGDTMTGDLILNADPSSALGAATKQYTDTKVAKSGSTMTGDLILNADPSAALGAATKQYVDAVQTNVNTKVSKSGDTMSGLLVLSGDPPAALGASTKQYTDTKVAKSGSTMTGDLILNADPSLDLGASTKQYTDTKVAKSGSTMTGLLVLSADPSALLGAATKQYVDAVQTNVNNKVSKTGDTMSGLLLLSGDPSAALGASTKQYTDTKVAKSGSTMTGDLILNADPSLDLGAATKQYADSKVAKSGSTMTGLLVLSADPSALLGAATKQYVDAVQTSANTKVSKSGDTMSGFLTLSADPTASLHASTKNYVDAKFAAVPSQVKVVTVPITFNGAYAITNPADTWGRIGLEVTIPNTTDIFPSAVSFTTKLIIDYNTTGGSTGRIALLDWNNNLSGTFVPVAGTDNAVVSTGNVWTKQTFSFAAGVLSGGKTYSLMIQRNGGTGAMQMEGATLVLTYS